MRSISKIALAGAVATACGYAAAGTLTGMTVTPYSLESAEFNTANVVYTGVVGGDSAGTKTAPRLAITTAALGTGQRLQLSPGTRAFGTVASHTQTFTCSAGSASAVFEIATGASGSTAVIYDVSIASGGSLNGASCLIPSIAFTAASMRSAGDVQVSGVITVVNTGATIDSFSATTIASVNNEFTVSIASGSELNAVLDVSSGRMTFASGTDAVTGLASADKLTVTIAGATARATIGGNYSATTFNLSLRANPSFAFLQESSTVAGEPLNCSVNSGSGQATAIGGSAVGSITLSPASGTCSTLSVPFTGIARGDYVLGLGRLNQNASSSTATPYAVNTYTASYTMTSGTITSANSSASLAAGSWTQNGTSARLNYIPVGSTTSLQILVSNTSTTAGDASFVAYSGGSTCSGTLGTISANGTTSIGGTLKNALQGVVTAPNTTSCTASSVTGGAAAVVLTLTTPSADTKVHSGFTVTGDTSPRQILINSTN